MRRAASLTSAVLLAIACDQGEVERDEPDDPVRTAMRQMLGVFAQLEREMASSTAAPAKRRGGRRVSGDP